MSDLIKGPAIDFARSIGHVRTCIGHCIAVSILKYDEDPKIKPTNIISTKEIGSRLDLPTTAQIAHHASNTKVSPTPTYDPASRAQKTRHLQGQH